jgi:hypothetical protein
MRTVPRRAASLDSTSPAVDHGCGCCSPILSGEFGLLSATACEADALSAPSFPDIVKGVPSDAFDRVQLSGSDLLPRGTRNRIVCRLHAVLCDLVAGGFPKHISAIQAAAVLESIEAVDAVGEARLELLADLRRVDEQRRAAKRRLTKIVAASGTTVSQVYGAGPVVTAAVIGDIGVISRFPTRDHFAAYNGTAPIEASSGNRTIYRLSRRGNRHLNHAIHMAAVSQISHHGTAGRDYYHRKIEEGMAPKSALRALKRKISDALYARMIADARRAARQPDQGGPGGQTGNDSASSATGSHPEPALRKSHSRTTTNSRTSRSYKPSPAPTKAGRRTT